MDLKRSLSLVAVLAALAGCADGEPVATAPPPDTSARPAPRDQRDEHVLALDDVDREVRGFAERLPRCTMFAQALELALASDCVDEAYAGLEQSVAGLDADDAAPACRALLRDYLRRVRRFHDWAQDTTAAARNRQFFDFNALAAEARRQTGRYERARTRVAACG